jgi:hypothetical protein
MVWAPLVRGAKIDARTTQSPANRGASPNFADGGQVHAPTPIAMRTMPQKSVCGRPRFARKFEFWWIGSFASICPACWWPLQGGWPRWVPQRKLQPVGTVSFCRWTSRDVLRLGSIDRAIFSLSCKLRTLGWPLAARSMAYTRGKRPVVTLPGRH